MLQTLRAGSSGNLVRAAKYLTGHSRVVELTDIYDEEFKSYVFDYQYKNDIQADGIIGPNTWRLIASKCLTCSEKKYKNSVWTAALQELLTQLTVDGIFGSKTKAALKAFQSANGLTADGVCGPASWNALIVGSETSSDDKRFVQPTDFKQGDSRWAKNMYSSHGDKSQTMKNSGCGPTACANVVNTLVDPNVNPWTLAQLSMSWGTRTYSNGTAWGFFKKVFDYYKKFSKFIQTTSMTTAKSCIDAGGYVVCSMKPGYWTKGGHFITMWKYQDGQIYCNDPASSSRKKQNEKEFVSQCKQYFCFFK